MSAADTSSPGASVRGNLVIGVVSIAAGAVVIPYGSGMPYVREGIPGPGLFPMMIGGMLILLGALVILTSVLSARRDRIHGEQLAAAEAGTAPDGTRAASTESAAMTTQAEATAADPATEVTSGIGAGEPAPETTPTVGPDGEPGVDAVESGAETGAAVESGAGAAVPASADDVAEEDMATQAVMDTDIGSDGPRRWINGAILMGSIVFYVLFAEILGFPLTMAILVTAIVWSLRARWWTAVLTGVLTSIGLWLMFEQGLLVQLPDGPFRGF